MLALSLRSVVAGRRLIEQLAVSPVVPPAAELKSSPGCCFMDATGVTFSRTGCLCFGLIFVPVADCLNDRGRAVRRGWWRVSADLNRSSSSFLKF